MIANYSPFRENALRYLANIIETKYRNELDESSTSGLARVYDTFWPGKRNIRDFFRRAGCEDFTTKVPENEYTYWSLVKIQGESAPDGRNKIFRVIEQLCDPEEYYDNPDSRNKVIEQVNLILQQYNYRISEAGTIIPYTTEQQALENLRKQQNSNETKTDKQEPAIKAERSPKITSQQELKNHIRSWIKNNQKVDSSLGEIAIGKLLGEGGNALVFESPFLGGTAVKFLAELVTSPPSTRYARFLDEYRNLIKLVTTAAVVPLYQFGIQNMEGDLVPYVVMERCVKTLHDVYKSSRLVSVSEFQHLLDRLLEILEVVHAAGIVHRDLKPQNILLRKNNRWVLADFGIAWFDPELHTKLAVSEKNERLANFEFSAPEQLKRQLYDKPLPSMDLYALGQTLYFCVTGHTIRGSGYPHFSHLVPELGYYDDLIDKLVRQVPEERLQSVSEIRRLLVKKEEGARNLEAWRREEQQRAKFQRYLGVFDLALRSVMPGAYGYVQAKGKDEIDKVMFSLAQYHEECNLWWFRGLSNNQIRVLEKLVDDNWLIDYHECEIVDLWICRHTARVTHQYILIQLAPRPSFGVYHSDNPDRTHEEVAFYKGRYITRAEYDDGYALIDGEVVELDDSTQLRFRNLQTDFLLLSSGSSIFNETENDRQVNDIYLALCNEGKINPSFLKSLEHLKLPNWKQH